MNIKALGVPSPRGITITVNGRKLKGSTDTNPGQAMLALQEYAKVQQAIIHFILKGEDGVKEFTVTSTSVTPLIAGDSVAPIQEVTEHTDPPRKRSILWAGVATLTVVMILIVAFASFNKPPETTETVAYPTVPEAMQKASIPGYSTTPSWTLNIQDNSKTTAFSARIVNITGTTLKLINPADGTVAQEIDSGGTVDFITEVKIDDTPTIVWKTGETLKTPDGKTHTIGQAKLSSAGGNLLVYDNSYKILTTNGLEEFTPPKTYTPVAASNSSLVSAVSEGKIVFTDATGKTTKNVALKAPVSEAKITQWLTITENITATTWATSSKTFVVTHTLDGEIKSSQEISTSPEWATGQGEQLATYGPYLYDLPTGVIVLDGTSSGTTFTAARGNIAVGNTPNGQILTDTKESFLTDIALAGITQNPQVAVIKVGSTLQGYLSAQATTTAPS